MAIAFAGVRSFFEMHYMDLKTRKRDYPSSTPDGAKKATTKAIRAIINNYHPQNERRFYALLYTLKDTGLRMSDTVALNCDIILNNPNKNFIPLHIKTIKTGYIAKTFLGEEAINAITKYIEHRRKGTRYTPPENITPKSPLFITARGTRLKRANASMQIISAFKAIGQNKMSPHSLRKNSKQISKAQT